jgi:hypothetical protein
MSSDDVGNHWVETVPNGDSEFNLGRQKPDSFLSRLNQQGGTTLIVVSPTAIPPAAIRWRRAEWLSVPAEAPFDLG